MAARRVEHERRAGHVHIRVLGGPLEARAHAGERRQVRHGVETVLGEEAVEQRTVADVARHELEASGGGTSLGPGQIPPLLGHVVERVEAVEPDDGASLGQQAVDERRADEARGSGDEHALAPARRAGARALPVGR